MQSSEVTPCVQKMLNKFDLNSPANLAGVKKFRENYMPDNMREHELWANAYMLWQVLHQLGDFFKKTLDDKNKEINALKMLIKVLNEEKQTEGVK